MIAPRSSLAAVVALFAAAPLTAQARPDRLKLADFLEWEEVVDFFSGGPGPQISPDGKQVIYSRRSIDKVNDRWDSSLWIMNADGSRNRFLTKGADARWSPDGTRIAFVRGGEPTGAQIFVRYMDAEGATTQVTHVEYGVTRRRGCGRRRLRPQLLYRCHTCSPFRRTRTAECSTCTTGVAGPP